MSRVNDVPLGLDLSFIALLVLKQSREDFDCNCFSFQSTSESPPWILISFPWIEWWVERVFSPWSSWVYFGWGEWEVYGGLLAAFEAGVGVKRRVDRCDKHAVRVHLAQTDPNIWINMGSRPGNRNPFRTITQSSRSITDSVTPKCHLSYMKIWYFERFCFSFNNGD